MKKLLSLLSISLLALVLAVPAVAADKPIQVYINGSSLTFAAGAPYLKNNTVLVPFRAIFERLGLQVLWEAQTGTVTGTGPDLNIRLKVGSKRASINGTVKQLTVAPVSAAGTTYIPLRFIAEATGGTAVWEASSRSVKITVPQSSSAMEQEVRALIQLSNKYYNEEQAQSFYSLTDEADPAEAVEHMKSQFELYDLRNTIDSLKILSLTGNSATVHTVERSVRTGGLYMPDEQYEYLYTLVYKNGVWRISGMDLQDSSVLLTREQGMKPAVVPQSDAAAIKNTVSGYYQNMTAKNVAGTMAVMTSFGEEYDTASKEELEDFFANYSLGYSPVSTNIYYYAAGEAAVYAEVTINDSESKETYTQSLIFLLSQSGSGSWTIDDTYHISFKAEQS
ncbi:copper amine oxidase N-terminal domain-containing protein [Paenibacillus piscarius]|uniref:copper amine oxidase N-terminal domain-containing protein n=1 Tax=Paenibacillus piscarius TaxID=1089681 RepID=UPI001EE7FDBA|nr:copper amine oxidase N-terminal domain-containing protein [Paenibacillus piscarius]